MPRVDFCRLDRGARRRARMGHCTTWWSYCHVVVLHQGWLELFLRARVLHGIRLVTDAGDADIITLVWYSNLRVLLCRWCLSFTLFSAIKSNWLTHLRLWKVVFLRGFARGHRALFVLFQASLTLWCRKDLRHLFGLLLLIVVIMSCFAWYGFLVTIEVSHKSLAVLLFAQKVFDKLWGGWWKLPTFMQLSLLASLLFFVVVIMGTLGFSSFKIIACCALQLSNQFFLRHVKLFRRSKHANWISLRHLIHHIWR